MTTASSIDALSISLVQPHIAPGAYQAFKVLDIDGKALIISLRRTIRVPDNGRIYRLPPDVGAFPIYNVLEHQDKLPKHLVEKGGVFIPIYQREAMWIKFEATKPFAVKIYVGDVNAISGEPKVITNEMIAKRTELLLRRKSIQDYIVSPAQLWLDGIAESDGKVLQFVAAPVGSGHSVEAQITGQESITGFQFEVIPSKLNYRPASRNTPTPKSFRAEYPELNMAITLKNLVGRNVAIPCASNNSIKELKDLVQCTEGISAQEQRLYLDGKQLHDHKLLADYNIKQGTVINLVLRLRGGMMPRLEASSEGRFAKLEQEVTASGSIKQLVIRDRHASETWITEKLVMLNLQLFNTTTFESLGIPLPPTPVVAGAHPIYGFPFPDSKETPSSVASNTPLNTAEGLDKAEDKNGEVHETDDGLFIPMVNIGGESSVAENVSKDAKPDEDKTSEAKESENFTPGVVKLNTVEQKSIFVPIRLMEKKCQEATRKRRFSET